MLIDSENIASLLSGYDIALVGSFFVSILIILTGRFHIKYSSRNTQQEEVQTSHVNRTPRVGGLAVFAGCIFAWALSENPASNFLGILII